VLPTIRTVQATSAHRRFPSKWTKQRCTGSEFCRRVALSLQQIVIILESERLLFRPHEPADLDSFCAMEMDPSEVLIDRSSNLHSQIRGLTLHSQIRGLTNGKFYIIAGILKIKGLASCKCPTARLNRQWACWKRRLLPSAAFARLCRNHIVSAQSKALEFTSPVWALYGNMELDTFSEWPSLT
jgi:hypothetical protein